jgi:hypothetical protein
MSFDAERAKTASTRIGAPRRFSDLSAEVAHVCRSFTEGLQERLADKLFGVYLYGAVVFPDSGRAGDLDCHVVLKEGLTPAEIESIERLHQELAKRHPPLGAELDAWYILCSAAQGFEPPVHQIKHEMMDRSWALHCAHIRAGYFITLCGPEPAGIFPSPSWSDISEALEYELEFIRNDLAHPAYCTLNLCRIVYSLENRDVVVSKQFTAEWAQARLPEWADLIQAAVRSYAGTQTAEDEALLGRKIRPFLAFVEERLQKTRRQT